MCKVKANDLNTTNAKSQKSAKPKVAITEETEMYQLYVRGFFSNYNPFYAFIYKL